MAPYEHRTQPLLPTGKFLVRLLRHWLAATGILLFSLALGVTGYRATEGMPWLDALLNASMLLGGMGPVDQLRTEGGKLFASFYALYAGVVFLAVAGIVVAPVVHRILHRLHVEK